MTSRAAYMGRPVGIEIFYFMDRWMDDQAASFHKAAECGYDGVEISLMPHVLDDYSRIQAESAKLGLSVLCSTGLTPETDISDPDPAIRRAGIEYLKRCLDTASTLNSPILGGVTYAPWFAFPDDDLEARRQRSAESLREVAVAADAVGVVVCMEILNRFETFMLNTVRQAQAFLTLIDHPAVQIELDTFHMNVEEPNLADAIVQAGPRLGHFQCAASNRAMPGKGHINWDEVAAALDAAAYDGWVVIETFPNPEVETGRSTHAFRPLVDDLMVEAEQAAAFVRRQLGGDRSSRSENSQEA